MEIKTLTKNIVEWADSVFPDRKPEAALLKLFEEVGELVKNPRSPGEYADICIMLFDLANMHKVDLAQAIKDKMKINRNRAWVRTLTGTMQHSDAGGTDVVDHRRQAYLMGIRDAREGSPKNPGNNVTPAMTEWYERGYDMAAGECGAD